MSDTVVIFVSSSNFSAAYQAASLGITAAAMKDQVFFVFAFDALRALAKGALGASDSSESEFFTRAQQLNVMLPQQMLEEARAIGARVVVCDTTMKLCGLTEQDLEGRIDEVMGLASIWRIAQKGRTLHF